MRVAKVEDHHSLKELEDLMKMYKNDAEVHDRLKYIHALKRGIKSNVIADVLIKSPQICSKWLKKYNEQGLGGITSKRSNSGVKAKLSTEDLEKLRIILTKTDQYYTIDEARDIIYLFFNVKYSQKQTWFIVKHKLKLNYEKPKNH